MKKIVLLDERTINQIAAGEVIENPASVVKELVENAIDAGSSEIVVETKGGGRGLIRVSDNGHGMSADDLYLAIERHATSKISTVHDLDHLSTLGFRGEALPSIASVSKFLLKSSLGDGGAEIEISGGKIEAVRPSARARGTTVEVRSLFFNVPVRRKFQKSISSDVAEIHKCLTNIALSHPELRLSWIHEGKMQFELEEKMPPLSRIELLLGEQFAASLIPIEEGSLKGYISKASHHRPNRTGNYLFINGRALFSSFISQKVVEAYGTRLPTHRFPLFVLYLTLPPAEIDVNVHPQKKEVRLCSPAALGESIVRSIEKSLAPPQKEPLFVFEQAFPTEELTFSLAEERVTYQPALPITESLELFPSRHEIVALFKGYIFVQEEEGMRVIDSRAALYRLRYEEVTAKRKSIEQQSLLFPQTIEVTQAEELFLMEQLEAINETGISIRHFGDKTFLVDAIPTFLEFEQIPSLIHQFFEKNGIELARLMSRVASKRVTSLQEASHLVEKLFALESIEETPDGEKISFLMTEEELKAKFK